MWGNVNEFVNEAVREKIKREEESIAALRALDDALDAYDAKMRREHPEMDDAGDESS